MSFSCVIRQARAGTSKAKAHADAGDADLNTLRADSTTCTPLRQIVSLPESSTVESSAGRENQMQSRADLYRMRASQKVQLRHQSN